MYIISEKEYNDNKDTIQLELAIELVKNLIRKNIIKFDKKNDYEPGIIRLFAKIETLPGFNGFKFVTLPCLSLTICANESPQIKAVLQQFFKTLLAASFPNPFNLSNFALFFASALIPRPKVHDANLLITARSSGISR